MTLYHGRAQAGFSKAGDVFRIAPVLVVRKKAVRLTGITLVYRI